MSRSYARTATYSAAASRNTLTTVRSLAGAPAEGSRCRNSVIESAPAQAGPPKRPSTEIGPVAVTTWRLCCAAVWTGTNNASVSKACSLSVPRIDCRPESAQHVREQAVGPDGDVIQVGGVTEDVDVNDLRLFADDVIVDCAHADVLMRQLGEHRTQLRRGENEITHHRRVVGLAAEPGPGAKRERRRDRDIPDPDGEVAAGEVIANVTGDSRGRRSENTADRIPDSGRRLLSAHRAGSSGHEA